MCKQPIAGLQTLRVRDRRSLLTQQKPARLMTRTFLLAQWVFVLALSTRFCTAMTQHRQISP
ncbi:hypothetical protein Fuma_01063 [Fuerstiella marisgermanici]|uniref:Uncharacterized protein n=1 Tax=Fuerstiella marisgermanici TaxID=1891926 RepID=A0A1P8WBN5_9PLAN|nr:hypothetical protein Fuma_01063 [Fuerstiella marisgermanici]